MNAKGCWAAGLTATESGGNENGICGLWPFDMGMGLYGQFWLRSPNNDNNAWLGNPGGGNNNDNVNNSYAVRPALPKARNAWASAHRPCREGKEPHSRPKPKGGGQTHAVRGADASCFRASSGIGGNFFRQPRPRWRCYGGVTITDFEAVCDFEHLYRAHTKARLGKRYKSDVIAFEMDLAHNLWEIKEALERGDYAVSGYKRFMIHDPKDREIQALCYADRIVQHSLCDNVLTPFFEQRLVYDNCACRVGKGTHFGMERLAGFMREHYSRHGPNGWILKADVRKFFQSIDHGALLERLGWVIPDQDVMKLIEHIVRSFNADTGKGLPMGNQTSQIFALYYLDPVDRLIKEKLRIKHYTRYMDDMVLLHSDKEYLRECLFQIRELCYNTLKLELNDKTQIFPMAHGVDYLGWHFYLTDTGKVVKRLRAQNKRRLKRRLKGLQKGYAEGRLQWEDIKRSMASTNGHLIHRHTYRLRAELYNKTVFARKTEEETVTCVNQAKKSFP